MITDADIASAVAYALRWKILSKDVAVTVEHGWVTLTGKVKDAAEKAAAESAALYLYGVRGIRNQIEMTPAAKSADPVRVIDAISMDST